MSSNFLKMYFMFSLMKCSLTTKIAKNTDFYMNHFNAPANILY